MLSTHKCIIRLLDDLNGVIYGICCDLIKLHAAAQTIRQEPLGINLPDLGLQPASNLDGMPVKAGLESHDTRITAAMESTLDRLNRDPGDEAKKINIRSADILFSQVTWRVVRRLCF